MWYYYYCWKKLIHLYFERNNHTIFLPYFNFNSKSPLFTKKLNVFKFHYLKEIKFGWNLFTVFHTLLLVKKLETILNQYKQWHCFFYILLLFDFINKNSMFLISMFLFFALVPKLVPRTVDFHWYRYRILKFWYRDNTSYAVGFWFAKKEPAHKSPLFVSGTACIVLLLNQSRVICP